MNYSCLKWMIKSHSINKKWLLSVFFYLVFGIGCTVKESQNPLDQPKIIAEPDLSKLPSSLRRRLSEGESRIKVLRKQKLVLEKQLKTFEQLEQQYQIEQPNSPRLLSEAKARSAEAHQKLALHERSLSELTNLVQRIKLQALAEEMAVDQQSDEQLKSLLTDAVDVYDELGQLSAVQRKAKLGQPKAQYKLGRRYEKGEGVDQSDLEALSWYVKAANQGHEQAALAAGFFYRHGKGTTKDLDKSIGFYKIAAELGNLVSANNLGLLHLDLSRKQDQDDQKAKSIRTAKKWFIMAASGEVKSAQLSLARLYLDEAENDSETSISKYKKAQALLKKARMSKREKIRLSAGRLLQKLSTSLPPRLKKEVSNTLRWIQIPQGSFIIDDTMGRDKQKVTRTISVNAFSLLATEVTVEQYKSCISAGVCSPIAIKTKGCTHRKQDSNRLPITCVSWDQARDFAQWVGGDLPSEVQWEYAARSAGQYTQYPWGDIEATCERAIMRENKIQNKKGQSKSRSGCGRGGPWPVCSKSAGMSQQGICDLIGNVWEWTLDEYRPRYDPKHLNDLPVCLESECKSSADVKRVIRGAGYMTKVSGATAVIRSKSDRAANGIGFRVAKREPSQ